MFKMFICTSIAGTVMLKENLAQGKNQKWQVFVFSHIRMMGYFRLSWVRVNQCPAGLENWSCRVRASRRS